jgi:hypothetical protein
MAAVPVRRNYSEEDKKLRTVSKSRCWTAYAYVYAVWEGIQRYFFPSLFVIASTGGLNPTHPLLVMPASRRARRRRKRRKRRRRRRRRRRRKRSKRRRRRKRRKRRRRRRKQVALTRETSLCERQ